MKKVFFLGFIILFSSQNMGHTISSPMYRYNLLHTGSINEELYPPLVLRWRSQIHGNVISLPAVKNGKLYVTSRDGFLRIFDAYTGEEITNYSTSGYIDSSPCVYGGRIYITSSDGKLYCFEDITTPDSAEIENPLWEFCVEHGPIPSSPVVLKDNVYLLPTSPENNFYIIDAASGTIKYKIALSQFSQSAPAIYDKNVVFPTNDGKIYNIDLSIGNIVWEYQTIGNLGYNSVTIDHNGVVYFIPGGDDFRLYAVDILTGEVLWHTNFLGIPGMYISSIVSSPALTIYNGKKYILVSTSGGALNKYTVYAIDGDNGDILWQRSFGTAPNFHTLPAPTIANEVVYVVSPTDKKLYALRLVDGAELWASPSSQTLENEIYVAPVVSNGWLYLIDYNGNIYAFEANVPSGGRTVCITSPDNDDTISTQYVPIHGTVNSNMLSSYRLEYAVYKDTDIKELSWKTIYIGTNTVYRSLLGVWDTMSENLPDGKYLLRVMAFNTTGSTQSSIVSVQLNAPPQPPENLTAFDTPNDQGYSITLTWKKSIDDGSVNGDNDVTEYRIYKSTSPERDFVLGAVLPAGTTIYIDNTVMKNQLYYYFLTAYDGLSESLPTSTVSVKGIDNIPPEAPRDVSGVAGDKMAKLYWKANIEPDLSHYNVYRDSGIGYVLISSVDKNNTTYYDYGLTNGITYYYKLTAVDDSYLESSPSYPPVIIIPTETADIIPPAKVTDLAATPILSEEGSILLEWTSTGDNNYSGDLENAKYHIRYTQKSNYNYDQAEYSLIISTTAKANQKEKYKISSLTPFTTYYFWIKIEDKRNNISEVSNRAIGIPIGIPPGKITDLYAMPGSIEGSILLTWTAPGNNGYSGEIYNGKYKIKYSTSPHLMPGNVTEEKVFSNVTISPGKKEIYILSGFLENIEYTFCVLAADNYNLWSVESNTASAVGSGIPPGKITDLTAKPGNTIGSILLTWTAPGDNSYADVLQNGSYEIKYTSSNISATLPEHAEYRLLWSTTTTPGSREIKVVTGLVPNVTYYFWLRAIDKFSNAGAFSEPASAYAQVDLFPPAPPTKLYLADVPDDYGRNVWIYWEKSTDDGGGDNDVVEYWIYRGTSTESITLLAKVPKNTTSYLDTSVVPNVRFYYYIRARDSYNLSLPSEIVSIIPISEWQEILTERLSIAKSIDNAEIVFPAESVSHNCHVIVHKLIKPDKEFPNTGIPKFVHALPEAWKIKFSSPEVKLLKSIIIKLPYPEEYINKHNIREENLRVFYWNTENKQWEIVNTSVPHPEEKRVWITAVPHFALYRIMEFIPFGEVLRNEECYVYPNPAVKCDIIYFKFRLYDKAEVNIYIYTISGEPVAHLTLEKNKTQAYTVHELPWWIRNIPSGVYIAKIEGKSDKNYKVLTKRFAIVN